MSLELDAAVLSAAQETMLELQEARAELAILKESLRWKTFEEELPAFERPIIARRGNSHAATFRYRTLNGEWRICGYNCSAQSNDGWTWVYIPPSQAPGHDPDPAKG